MENGELRHTEVSGVDADSDATAAAAAGKPQHRGATENGIRRRNRKEKSAGKQTKTLVENDAEACDF